MTVAHRVAVAAALTLLVVAPAAPAAPGDLDPSFGGDGIVQSTRGEPLGALAISGDRILAAGMESGGDDCRDVALVRAADGSAITGGDTGGQAIGNDGEIVTAHTPAGALDPSFGDGDGFVHYGDYFHGHINDLVRLADGRIAGVGLDYGIRNGWGLSRYD